MSVYLSKERFDSTPFGSLISWGIIENSPDGVYMTSEDGTFPLLWTAWKGEADDWAIYVTRTFLFTDSMKDPWTACVNFCHYHGDKVFGKDLIARMIDADHEVLERYRR